MFLAGESSQVAMEDQDDRVSEVAAEAPSACVVGSEVDGRSDVSWVQNHGNVLSVSGVLQRFSVSLDISPKLVAPSCGGAFMVSMRVVGLVASLGATAILGGTVRMAQAVGGVDQADMRERLGEVAELASGLDVVLLGEESDVVA